MQAAALCNGLARQPRQGATRHRGRVSHPQHGTGENSVRAVRGALLWERGTQVWTGTESELMVGAQHVQIGLMLSDDVTVASMLPGAPTATMSPMTATALPNPSS